jgi:chromosome partitioning protein
MILALINNKGGVGKTTSAVNLAAALVRKNEPVLLIDMDSQAAASLSVGVTRPGLKPSIADVLLRNEPIDKVIRKTKIDGLDVVTGCNELAIGDVCLANNSAKEACLKNALEPIIDRYEHIIIDCPPSLSLLSINALVAAEFYIVPTTPQFLTLGGLASLVQEVNTVCGRNVGEVAHLMGFLLTMVDHRNRSSKRLIETMREAWKHNVFKTEIHVNIKLTEAPATGKTIFGHAPSSTGAQAYRDLAREVLRRYKELTEPEATPGDATPPENPASDQPQNTPAATA